MTTPPAAARPLRTGLPVTGMPAVEAMPPFVLPGSHFAVALGWLGVASAGLAVAAPGLARGAWLGPGVAAAAHAFTLGWLLTSAYGALYQLGPVVLGVEPRRRAAAWVTLGVHTAGSALVVVGLGAWIPALIGLGWTLVALGLAVWTWNVASRLWRAPRMPHIGRIVLAATGALWLGLLLAGARVGHALGWWMVSREALVGAHVQLAAIGFGTLLVMGIGSRLVPMFLLSREVPDRALRWAAPLAAVGVVLNAVGALAGHRQCAVAGGMLTAAGIALFLYQARLWYVRRARPVLDPSLRQVAASLVFLGLALVAGVAALLGAGPRAIGAYGVLLVVGWLGVLIAAVYARIVPFLTWMHRYSPRVGEKGLPKVGDLVPASVARVQGAAWVAGTGVLAAGIVAGLPSVALAGACLFAAGSALALGSYARLWLRPDR
jgi:hypothetical protein